MFDILIRSRSCAFQQGIDEARTVAQKGLVVFAHKTDLFIDKRLR